MVDVFKTTKTIPETSKKTSGPINVFDDGVEEMTPEKIRSEAVESAKPSLSNLQRFFDVSERLQRAGFGPAESAFRDPPKNLEEFFTKTLEPAKESLSPVSIAKTIYSGTPQKEGTVKRFEDVLIAGGVPELGRYQAPSISQILKRSIPALSAIDMAGVPIPYARLGELPDPPLTPIGMIQKTVEQAKDIYDKGFVEAVKQRPKAEFGLTDTSGSLRSLIQEKGLRKGSEDFAKKEKEDLEGGIKFTGREALGLAGDIYLDPINAITLGTAKAAKYIGKIPLTKSGAKTFSNAIETTTKNLLEEYAQKGIKKTAEEVVIDANKRLARELRKGTLLNQPIPSNFIDKGGLKFFGKTVISNNDLDKAFEVANQIVPDVVKTQGKALKEKTKGAAQYFSRSYGVDEKLTDIADSILLKQDYYGDVALDKFVNAIKVGEKPIEQVDRMKIGYALSKASDDAVEALAEVRLKNLGALNQLEVNKGIGANLIKNSKQLSKDINKNQIDQMLQQIKGLGDKSIQSLSDLGVKNVEDLASMKTEDLLKAINKKLPILPKRIGKKTAQNIIDQAKLIKDQEKIFDSFEKAMREVVGIGPKRAEFLKYAGIDSIEKITELSPEQIIVAMDKSARGLGLLSLKKNKAFAEGIKKQADILAKQSIESLPKLKAEKERIMNEIRKVHEFLDDPAFNLKMSNMTPDQMSNLKLSEYYDLVQKAKNNYKKVYLPEGQIQEILNKRIKELPSELRQPAYEIFRILKNAEKKDLAAGTLKNTMPIYFPRKYKDLMAETSVPYASKIGKTLGGRTKHRTVGTLEEALAIEGKQLIEDSAVPVADRLIKGVNAREIRKGYDQVKEFFGVRNPKTGVIEVPKQIIDDFERLINRGMKYSPDKVGKFLKNYDEAIKIYKGFLTSYFPGFHFRNKMSNEFFKFLAAGVDGVDPVTASHAFRMKAGANGYIDTVFGNRISYDKILDDAKRYGVLKGYWKSDVGVDIAEKLSKKMSVKKVSTLGREVGQQIEEFDRLSLFTTFIKKGMDPDAAAKQVNKFLFDYGDLSDFEQRVMKRLFPFYTFKRKSIEMLATEMIKQPKVFNGLNDFIRFLDDEDLTPSDMAKLPAYLQNRIIIKTGPESYLTGLDVGLEDMATTLGEPIRMGSQLSPPIKFAIESFSQKNLFRDKTLIEAAQNINDLPPFLYMNDPFKSLLGVKKKKDPRYVNGEKAGEKWVYYATNPNALNIIRNLPTSRFQSVAAESSKEDNKQFWQNFLTGTRESKFPKSLSGYLQNKNVEEEMKRLGAKEFKSVYIPGEKKTGRKKKEKRNPVNVFKR